MTAIPMRLEDALRFNGYTIGQTDVAASDITIPEGVIHIPAMRLSSLTWQRGTSDPATPSDSFYLAALPMFNAAYQPVILSHILDRFSTRRISYDTPDQFGLAVRRWINLNLGPTSVLNRLYTSTAYPLPLTSEDLTVTDKSRVARSDFPQTALSGNVDYASDASDNIGTETRSGRSSQSVMELLQQQRAAYLNADEVMLDAMDSLFLQVWDRDELDDVQPNTPFSAIGFLPTHW